MKQHIKVVLM